MKSTLILLTLNEIRGLNELYDKIPIDAVDEVLAIDGGSTDGTLEFYKDKGIKAVVQEIPGRGRAFIEGMKHAKHENLIFFSPDGNENQEDIPKIVKKLNEGYDLVIASRFMKGAKSDDSDDPLYIRHLGNNFYTLLVNLFWRANVTDAINGFRGIKKSKLKQLHSDATGHEIEFQITIRSTKLGYKIGEIPTHELKRVGGQRKANTAVMGYRFTRFFIKELMNGKRF